MSDDKPQQIPQKPGKERIRGVFSTQAIQKVGTGTTVRKTIQKTFWMVEQAEDGTIETQPLNTNYVPSGPTRVVALEDLLAQFSPEPEFYVHTVFPAMQKLSTAIDKGDEHRAKGEVFSAEHRYIEALNIDVDNVRANFGLGLTYFDRGERAKAENILERLVKLDAAFSPEHKHLFNEFGVSLRKSGLLDKALEYYEKAKGLSSRDENLHYNIARVWFDKSVPEKAVACLDEALGLNPDLEVAKKFRDWILEKKLIKTFDDPGAETAAPAA